MGQLTIGQLAKRAGISRSALRFYEEQGLLSPATRSAAGYRLYDDEASQTLVFIQRAQRLGFSLGDIKAMLDARQHGDGPDRSVASIAEHRYLEIERQLTELLVQRHEMGSFLEDLDQSASGEIDSPENLYKRLVARVCGHDQEGSPARATLAWLLATTGCALAGADRDALIRPLAGRHIHVWRDGDGYRVLIPGRDAAVRAALEAIASLEAECHAHEAPKLEETDEGFVFIAEGDEAFLFAQFFLDLESTNSEQTA